ncbi:hypothetical protein BDV93DRAFT_447095, partial [Ceratobasidium sp. AG-I]
ISGLSHSVHKSATAYTAFLDIRSMCKDSISTDIEVPSKRVATRWNSDLQCAESHWALRAPIEMMTANSRYNMGKYRLSPDQWDLLNEMCQCLKVFKEPTLIFSQKETALIHEVIPSMDLLKFRLELIRDDVGHVLHPVTRVAANVALTVLDKYFNIMRESDVYWMATVLCPWYKLDWFVGRGYPPPRVQEIRQMLCDQFARANRGPISTTSAQTPMTRATVASRASLPDVSVTSAVTFISRY